MSRPADRVRYEDIAATARRLFVVKGYHATTMEEIASEVGILKGSLYYHISGKSDLLFRILDASVRDVLTRTQDSVADAKRRKLPFPEVLDALVITEVTAMADHREDVLIWVQERSRLPESCQSIDAAVRDVDAVLWQVLEEGADLGAWPRNLLSVRYQALRSLFARLPSWFDPQGEVPIEEVARDFSRMARAMLECSDRFSEPSVDALARAVE